ncbi:MAG: cytochrome c-type biogenesis CcmF C-terminal domain-containing protein, partial [bacterium]
GWVSQAFPWVLFASSSLGMGLMLGAYWAYGVLGWGGYWGWDPVENSSLVPWITSVALIHTLLAQRRSQKYVRTNFALAIISFLLVVYSTFLTRSGILGESSVHSFTDPGSTVYWLLLGFLAFIAVLGFGLLAARWKELKALSSDAEFVSRETALGAGTIALLLSAGVVLFGTSLPIFSKTSVEPAFYDTTNLPIAIAIGFLIGLSLFIQWKVDEWKEVAVRAFKSVAASVLLTVMLMFAGIKDALVLLFIFTTAFAFFTNLELLLRTRNGGIQALGGKFAHIGIAIMFLGIIATGKFSRTEHLSLALNTPQEAFGYKLMYTGYNPTSDGKFAFNVSAEKDGNKFVLAPVMFQAGEQGLMRNPDIASFLTRDIYISPVSLDQSENHAGNETYTIPKGETVSMGVVKATFVKFDMNAHSTEAMTSGQQGMAIGSVLTLSDGKSTETITPLAHYGSDGTPTYTPTASKLVGGFVQLVSMNVGMSGEGASTVTVNVQRSHELTESSETLVVEASIKPYIGLLWAGTVVMIIGFIFAIIKRSTEA